MGIGSCSCSFVGAAKAAGVDFSRLAMIGRQSFWPDKKCLGNVFRALDIKEDAAQFLRDNDYSENFFSLLGATEIVSFDASAYEDATVICDMNYPVAEAWHKRFSCVYEGGTIEHVFNIVQALKNCMNMVEVGGYFTQVNVANNCLGHGYWQLSPEMMFDVFSEVNGFQIKAVLMREVAAGADWYIVKDPSTIRKRVKLCNSRPTHIFTIAKRIKDVEVLATFPQQRYYEGIWGQATGHPSHTCAAGVTPSWRDRIPQQIKDLAAWWLAIRAHKRKGYKSQTKGFSPSSYQKITESELLRGSFVKPFAGTHVE